MTTRRDRMVAMGVLSGKALSILRKERRLSQCELGDLTGTSQTQLSEYENGLVAPKFCTLLELLFGLGYDLHDLQDTMDLIQHHAVQLGDRATVREVTRQVLSERRSLTVKKMLNGPRHSWANSVQQIPRTPRISCQARMPRKG